MLASLGGNSPYLAELALREPAALRLLARSGPDALAEAALGQVAALPAELPRPRLAAALREAKRQRRARRRDRRHRRDVAARSGDGRALGLAEAALRARGRAPAAGRSRRRARCACPTRRGRRSGSGFVVLGMGKLGARELNYSCDIDLVLLYDPRGASYARDEPRAPLHTRSRATWWR